MFFGVALDLGLADCEESLRLTGLFLFGEQQGKGTAEDAGTC